MAIQAPRGTTDPLHSIAHGISLANESCEPRVATQAIPNIMHVSGAPFKSPAQAGYLQDTSAKTLCPWQLDRTGCTLECAFDRVLGHGGFARVYSGQVCHSLCTTYIALAPARMTHAHERQVNSCQAVWQWRVRTSHPCVSEWAHPLGAPQSTNVRQAAAFSACICASRTAMER